MSFSMPCEGSEIDSHEIAFDESEKETPASREDHTGEDGVTTMEDDPVCRNGLVPLLSFDEPVIDAENKDVSAKDDVFQQVMASWGSSFREELDNSALQRACGDVKEKDSSALLEHIRISWQSAWQAIPAFARQDEDKGKSEWFEEQGSAVVASFVTDEALRVALISDAFIPELPLNSTLVGQDRAQIEACLAKLRTSDQEDVRIAVDKAFNKQLAILPAFARSTDLELLKAAFKEKHYFEVLVEVSHAKVDLACWTWVPEISPDMLQDAKRRNHAIALIPKITRVQAEEIDKEVSVRWRQQRDALAAWMPEESKSALKSSWMESHYYEIATELLPSCMETDSGRAPYRSTPANTISGGSSGQDSNTMFRSPKRLKKTNSAAVLEPRFNTIVELHTHEADASNAVKLEAYVLHFPNELRQVTVTDQRTQKTEQVGAMTVLLADRTGPILLEAWRDVADNILSIFLQMENDSFPLEVFAVEVSGFAVDHERRTHVGFMRKLHATKKTQFVLRPSPTQNSLMDGSVHPSPQLFTRDFSKLLAVPPFIINIVGVIADVKGITESESGISRREFKLQGSGGKYISCIAFGRHADSELLAPHNEVILYFASGKSDLRQRVGVLWLYDESHVMLLRQVFLPGLPSQAISFAN